MSTYVAQYAVSPAGVNLVKYAKIYEREKPQSMGVNRDGTLIGIGDGEGKVFLLKCEFAQPDCLSLVHLCCCLCLGD